MAVKRSGLGKNLSALLGNHSLALDAPSIVIKPQNSLPVAALQPGKYQPRRSIDDQGLEELAGSIKQQGLLQPIVVRPLDEHRYEIIAGERRWRASQLAGCQEVPVIIKEVDDETAMAMALVENLQREDLNPMDQARAMLRLHEDFNLTHQQIAELLSKSRTAVSNFLRLLSLAAEVKLMLEHGDLDMGHARALLALEDELQIYAAKLIIAKNLSVRETEHLVQRIKKHGKQELSMEKKGIAQKDLPFETQIQLQNLAKLLHSKVNVKPGKNGKGSLVIHYNNLTDLNTVISQIIRE